jgi:rhodanese-related sulfurtransferase
MLSQIGAGPISTASNSGNDMPESDTGINRISIDDVKRRSEELVFVDARSATSLRRDPTQVPGAIHVPVKELDQRIKLLPRDRTLVTYCT